MNVKIKIIKNVKEYVLAKTIIQIIKIFGTHALEQYVCAPFQDNKRQKDKKYNLKIEHYNKY